MSQDTSPCWGMLGRHWRQSILRLTLDCVTLHRVDYLMRKFDLALLHSTIELRATEWSKLTAPARLSGTDISAGEGCLEKVRWP